MTTRADALNRTSFEPAATTSLVGLASAVAERGLVPDALVRMAIRQMCGARLRQERAPDAGAQRGRLMAHIADLRQSAVAIHTDAANRQHYELPARFFERVLGPRLKYSAGLWTESTTTLAESEEAMLRLSCERARLADGQDVLELGCGWGSLTLFMAERFPGSRIVALSNSHSQRRFILERAAARGLRNVEVVTADINDFATVRRFDRVVSVEMFEHVRNYERLLSRVASWLQPAGLLFVHIFAHARYAYPFVVRDATDWMAQHFFTGGQMPSDDLLLYCQKDLSLKEHWRFPGWHYEKTSNAWLKNMDANRDELKRLFEATCRQAQARQWWGRWRMFFMACAEMFGYRDGEEWGISHYLFEKREA
ncbi:MAG: SAM-dependent methyltransferase [Bacteroidales bacterium]